MEKTGSAPDVELALIQMSVCPDKAENLRRAARLVAEAAADGADVAVLPEMFCCEYRNRAFMENREPAGGGVWRALSDAARENRIYLVGGSMPEAEGDRTYNTSFVFDRRGRQIARHRKMHLFDIDVPGGQSFQESRTFSAGDEMTLFDTEFGKMGLMVCFDIRFPELPRLMALGGAQLIFCPAAFNMTTGPAHWELFFRCCAAENQVFLAGCAPARDENGCYVSYGHSILCSPWGGVLAQADTQETTVRFRAELGQVARVRQQLPLLTARRTDVYTLELRRPAP